MLSNTDQDSFDDDFNELPLVSVELDTIAALTKILDGVASLAAIEGFDRLVDIIQSGIDYLEHYPQEYEHVHSPSS